MVERQAASAGRTKAATFISPEITQSLRPARRPMQGAFPERISKTTVRPGRIKGCRNYQKTITAKRKGSIVGYNGTGCKVYKDNKVSKNVKTRKIGYGNRRLA